ncbi:hypothetical protein Tco_0994183 [Tanacetum coccineum]
MFLRETIEGAQGYKVKDANKAILEAILKKHDGLEATCRFSDAALRTSLLYVVAGEKKAYVVPKNVGRDHYPLWAALLMNNRREHHTRAYLSPVEDSRARNVSSRNHRGCSRLEGLGMFFQETIEGSQGYKVKDANKAILEAILKKDDGLEATCLFLDAALRTSLLYVECHTRAYLFPVEDSRARNVLPRNHRGCSRLEGEERKRSNPLSHS